VYRTFPSEYDASPSEVVMRLPLDGPVTVAWGGPTRRVNYHVRSPAERWAFDLLETVDGESHRGTGESVTDYYAYDRPVRSPADGRVVRVIDGVPDALPDQAEAFRRGGNVIVLEVARDQYLFMVHLKAGSLTVAPGDDVKRGDVLARVGNSGNTSEPHLHVHLQDTPMIARGQGIPFYFADYADERSGRIVDRGMPQGGVRRGQYVGDLVRHTGQ
jgi:murein DD-endopeptidase MepM/ murein hydrolase activator NlpD